MHFFTLNLPPPIKVVAFDAKYVVCLSKALSVRVIDSANIVWHRLSSLYAGFVKFTISYLHKERTLLYQP